MTTQLYAAILREHSEHVSRLAATLSTTLTQLEHALSIHAGPPVADTAALYAGVAKLQQKLSTETELLGQRLHVFLEIRETAAAPAHPAAEHRGG
jgi:hypothetical protein